MAVRLAEARQEGASAPPGYGVAAGARPFLTAGMTVRGDGAGSIP